MFKRLGSRFLLVLFLAFSFQAFAANPASETTSFQEGVERIFSPSILDSVAFDDGHGDIVFKSPKVLPDYFETGDKANKIFAIDSCRLFRDMPYVSSLSLKLPVEDGPTSMTLNRLDVEDYYGIDFSEMHGDMDAWRSFSADFNNKTSRESFVESFQ